MMPWVQEQATDTTLPTVHPGHSTVLAICGSEVSLGPGMGLGVMGEVSLGSIGQLLSSWQF